MTGGTQQRVSRESNKRYRNRRRFMQVAGGATAVGLAGCLGMFDDDDDQAVGGDDDAGLETVHFTMSWIPVGYYAPKLLALDKGFWAERGLSVQVSRGYGSGDTVQEVGAGNTDIGNASSVATASGIAEGLDIVQIGNLMPRPGGTIYSLPDAGIETLDDYVEVAADLPGAHAPGAIEAVTNQIIYEDHGGNWDDVDITESFSLIELLLEGEVDWMTYWLTNAGSLWYGEDPVDPNIIYLGDHIQTLGNGFCCQREYLENNRDVVERFLDGLYEGYKYVWENGEEAVDEAIDTLFRYFEEMAIGEGAREFHYSSLQLMLSIMMSDSTQEHGIGYINEDIAERTIDMANEHILETELTVDEVYNVDDRVIESGRHPIPNWDESVDWLSTITPDIDGSDPKDNPIQSTPFN